MSIKDLIVRNRSYRRFKQNERMSKEQLIELVDLARLSATARNMQPLKFIIINEPADCKIVFPSTMWAGYLKDWDGPAEGERPSAYIIILEDTSLKDSFGVDHGIAAQSILLGAAELGFGGCMIGSINRKKLRQDISLPEVYKILLIVALGKPAERVVIDEVVNGNIKYWRDEEDIHHVPKRNIGDIILDINKHIRRY